MEINIVTTFEVSTTPSYIVAVETVPGDKPPLLLPPGLHGLPYTLIRLSKVEGSMVPEELYREFRGTDTIGSIIGLDDGSWEICIHESHRRAVRNRLQEIFPDSDVDLDYNPFEPTADSSEDCEHDMARRRCRRLFVRRATRLIGGGSWPAAAKCYTDLLNNMFED